MEFLDTLSYWDIIGLYIITPTFIAIIFYGALCDKGKQKALMLSFCSAGSFFPIFNTIVSEIKDVALTICKITNSIPAIIILTGVASIAIIVAITMGWIGCIDTSYQLLFPKKKNITLSKNNEKNDTKSTTKNIVK